MISISSPAAYVATKIGPIAREFHAVAINLALKRANIGSLTPLEPLSTPCLPESAVTQRPIFRALSCSSFTSFVPETS